MKEKDTVQKASAPWLKTSCKYRQTRRTVNYWFSEGCWYPVVPKILRSLALKISITIREESKPCYFDTNVLERNQHADILRQAFVYFPPGTTTDYYEMEKGFHAAHPQSSETLLFSISYLIMRELTNKRTPSYLVFTARQKRHKPYCMLIHKPKFVK